MGFNKIFCMGFNHIICIGFNNIILMGFNQIICVGLTTLFVRVQKHYLYRVQPNYLYGVQPTFLCGFQPNYFYRFQPHYLYGFQPNILYVVQPHYLYGVQPHYVQTWQLHTEQHNFSLLSAVMKNGLRGLIEISRTENRIPTLEIYSSLFQNPDPLWGPPSLLLNWYRDSFLVVKRPERKVNHSPAYNPEVKNDRSYTSTPPIRLYGVKKNNLTFDLFIPTFVSWAWG